MTIAKQDEGTNCGFACIKLVIKPHNTEKMRLVAAICPFAIAVLLTVEPFESFLSLQPVKRLC